MINKDIEKNILVEALDVFRKNTGLKVEVDHMQFQIDRRIDAVIRIKWENFEKKYAVEIKSTITRTTLGGIVQKLNFLGEKGIMVLPGTSKEYLKPNSVIIGENKDLMSIAKNILSSAKEKVEEGDLNRVIANISESVGSLNEILGKVNTKVDNLDMALYNTQIMELGQAGKGRPGW